MSGFNTVGPGGGAAQTITDTYVLGGGVLTLNPTQAALDIDGAALAAGAAGDVGPNYLEISRGATDVLGVAYNATDGLTSIHTAATAGLALAPDPAGGAIEPPLTVLPNKLQLFDYTYAFTAGGSVGGLINWNDTITFAGVNPTLSGFISIEGTFEFNTSANPFGMGNALLHAATWKNANGVVSNLGPSFLFANNAIYQADGATITMSQARVFFDNSMYETINGGVMSMSGTVGHNSLYSALTVNAGVTIGLRRGLFFADASGAGTLTTQIALDIENLSGATTNIGIRSAMSSGTFINHTGTAPTNLGGNLTLGGTLQLDSSTVAGVPSASPAGQMLYISDETGGAIPAFSDGTNWRRVSDRAIIS